MSHVFAKGGGGGSGQVSYPEYMETQHETWLDEIAVLITSIVDESPYEAAVAYDPDTDLANSTAIITGFNNLITGIDKLFEWESSYNKVDNKFGDVDTEITSKINAHKAYIDNDINTNILPKFKRSMQNVNASMSSAFIIGESIILEGRDRDVNKFAADLRLDYIFKRKALILQAVEQIEKIATSKYDFYKALVHYTVESNRIKIIAKNEENTTNIEYDVKDILWGLTSYREGANMLAAIGGGIVQSEPVGPSKAQSAIGGALSGAAVGASVGGPYGAVIGGAVGLVAGLIS